MEYLFVLFALASIGVVFAGLKSAAGNRKNITRLQL